MLKGIYTILSQDIMTFTLQMSAADHPIFKAHFPKYALLPGFALIDIVTEVLKDKPVEIKQCKFISPILPNDIIMASIVIKEKRKNIKIFKNKIKISELNYETM